jgi:small-conductance mechanosensitive channel
MSSRLFILFLLFLPGAIFAQHDTARQTWPSDSARHIDDSAKHPDDSAERIYDSATTKLFKTADQFGAYVQKRNQTEYSDDTIATKQDEIIGEIRRLTIDAKASLENGLDTTGLTAELSQFEHWYDIAADGVFTNAGTLQTNRNLETSYTIMDELLTRVLRRKSSLDDHYKRLVVLRNKIDSLDKADVLYLFSSDSAAKMRYVKKLVVVSQEIKPIDSGYRQTLSLVSELQTTVNRFVNKVNSSLAQIELFQHQLSGRTFTRESTNLGGAVTYSRPFSSIIDVSIHKGILAIAFYIRNEIGLIILVLFLILATTLFFVSLKRNLRSKNLLATALEEQPVLKYPALSATVIVLNLTQFVFPNPPFVVNLVVWTVSAVFLTIILKDFSTGTSRYVWIALFILFFLAAGDNLILQATRTERWLMLALSLTGVLCCTAILLTGRKKEYKERLVVYFIGFVILMQVASVFANIYGRYNLSKTCLTSGFFNIVIAILFLWTLRSINVSLSLAAKAYDIGERKLFYLNLGQVGGKPRPIFYVILVAGWFVLFSRNFYIHKMIADPFVEFIQDKRTIGAFSFTIGSVILFFLIIYLSALTSRIVSFFMSERYSNTASDKQRKGIGSWLLIIRIFIISTGLLLAFATLGIPMDRLTIILSALGVGIGFGLQTLVNNLVSGLIISFEKPVNVGDFVEIGGRSGTVRSIGFRSSILFIGNGSQVVIPNGDLLNQHLVNWTHDNVYRSVDIAISVAFGTDLGKAIQLLKDLPVKDERVLSIPAPGVIIRQFSSSSIDLQLTFWVRDLQNYGVVRTDILVAIDTAFKENHIEIPYPQQDLHIRSDVREKTHEEGH